MKPKLTIRNKWPLRLKYLDDTVIGAREDFMALMRSSYIRTGKIRGMAARKVNNVITQD